MEQGPSPEQTGASLILACKELREQLRRQISWKEFYKYVARVD